MASFRICAGDRRVQDAGLRKRGHVRVGKLAAAIGIAEPAAAHVPAFGPGRRSGSPAAAADLAAAAAATAADLAIAMRPEVSMHTSTKHGS